MYCLSFDVFLSICDSWLYELFFWGFEKLLIIILENILVCVSG